VARRFNLLQQGSKKMTAKNDEFTNLERRFFGAEVRATTRGGGLIISGLAAVYDQETVISDQFREVIKPGAFTRVLSEKPDVVCVPNHNWDVVLGRTAAGTLALDDQAKGLHYENLINQDDGQAMSFYSRVKRGDVRNSSFAFTVKNETWTETGKAGQLPLRTILEIDQLIDVSPVTFPAYPTTSADVRSKLSEFKRIHSRRNILKRKRLELAGKM
jgi:HK97 family phage prohead protease